MSSRFHQKYHRYNHHSVPPGTGDIAAYPDEGFDPIASFDSPFKGEFYSTGDIIGKTLSANEGLYSGAGLYVAQQTTLGTDLSVAGNLTVGFDTIIRGDLTVLGDTTVFETTVQTSSALEITNNGTGPALKVTQNGAEPIAHFIDANGGGVYINDNSYVGIGTDDPRADLHIKSADPGFGAELKIQSARSILTFSTTNDPVSTSDFTISKEEDKSVVFSTQTFGNTLEQIYNFKNRDNANVISLLSSGKVGINMLDPLSVPNKTLTIFGETSSTDILYAPKIGVNTDTPDKTLTVIGDVSASDTLYVSKASIGSDEPPTYTLTVIGDVGIAQTVTMPRFILTDPWIPIIEPSATISLPVTAYDIELNTTTNTTVTAFTEGLRGVLYMLTNIGTAMLTLTSTLVGGGPKIYVRNGTAWKSHTYSLSSAYLQLPPNTSCSLRVGNGGIVSVW